MCQFDIFYVKYANIYAHMYKKTLKSFWRNRIKMKLKGQCCGASSQTATCNAGIPRKGRFKNKLVHFQSSSLVGEEKMPWCLGLRHHLGNSDIPKCWLPCGHLDNKTVNNFSLSLPPPFPPSSLSLCFSLFLLISVTLNFK